MGGGREGVKIGHGLRWSARFVTVTIQLLWPRHYEDPGRVVQ